MQTGIGIIGLGFMGATHVKAWLTCADARIAAICNPSGRRLDGDFGDVSGNLGTESPLQLDMTQTKAYRAFDAMLADPDVHVIDLCTPTPSHHDLAIAALRAGKHVLCEKPMARTSAQALAMIEAARTADRLLMPAMCLRFWPGWAWLREAIQDGRYGAVRSARFTRIAEPPAWNQAFFFDGAQSGGALLDLHIHDTDFVRFLFGDVINVESTGYTAVSGLTDHVMTRYHVASGAIVHAEGSWAMQKGFGFRMAYTVNFEHATADYASDHAEPLFIAHNGEKQVIPCEGTGHAPMVQHFLHAVRSGTQPSIVTAHDGYEALQLCEREAAAVTTAAM